MGVAHAERDLSLHEVVLRNWVSELAADAQRAFRGLEISPRYWEYNRAGCAARSLVLSGARPAKYRKCFAPVAAQLRSDCERNVRESLKRFSAPQVAVEEISSASFEEPHSPCAFNGSRNALGNGR